MVKQITSFLLFFLCFSISNEKEIKTIPLEGQITNPKKEISGLDWYKNNLFLLPENLEGYIFIISKIELIKSIKSKKPVSILPLKKKFDTPNFSVLIPGFEGFESISFYKNNFIVTIEAKHNKLMKSYIAWGEINPKTLELRIPKDNLLYIKTPMQINNMTYESSLIYKKDVIFFYEANGKNLQKNITQPKFSLENKSFSDIKFPNIEYRITDVTKLDKNNKFWGINYFWPGDEKHLIPANDLLIKDDEVGTSHSLSKTVERLVEFQIIKNEIIITETKPIQLKLDKNSRNWEGIVRLDNEGFIIVTDKYPKMILAFVEYK